MRGYLAAALLVMILLFAFAGCAVLFQEQQACNARGGAYVREFLGYTCVVPR